MRTIRIRCGTADSAVLRPSQYGLSYFTYGIGSACRNLEESGSDLAGEIGGKSAVGLRRQLGEPLLFSVRYVQRKHEIPQ